jgi:hypothetical protein
VWHILLPSSQVDQTRKKSGVVLPSFEKEIECNFCFFCRRPFPLRQFLVARAHWSAYSHPNHFSIICRHQSSFNHVSLATPCHTQIHQWTSVMLTCMHAWTNQIISQGVSFPCELTSFCRVSLLTQMQIIGPRKNTNRMWIRCALPFHINQCACDNKCSLSSSVVGNVLLLNLTHDNIEVMGDEKKLKIKVKGVDAGNHSLMKDKTFDFVIQVTPMNE